MKLPNPKWFIPVAIVYIIFMIIILYTCVASAEEGDWDKLIPCVIQAESSGNPNTYNKKSGAIGLMQITPIVLKEWNLHYHEQYLQNAPIIDQRYNIGDLYKSSINVTVGTWYLKRIWNHYLPHYKLEQSLENLLACYNFGIGNVKNGKNFPRETVNYIKKIKKCLRRD